MLLTPTFQISLDVVVVDGKAGFEMSLDVVVVIVVIVDDDGDAGSELSLDVVVDDDAGSERRCILGSEASEMYLQPKMYSWTRIMLCFSFFFFLSPFLCFYAKVLPAF